MPKVDHNLPAEPLRWPLSRAAAEFGTDRETLSVRLKKLGHSPDERGSYSTKQILAAISDGGVKEARVKQILQDTERSREQTEFYRLRNDGYKCVLWDKNIFQRGINAWLTSAVQIVKTSGLDTEKQDLLVGHLAEGAIRTFEEIDAEQKEAYKI